MEIASALHEGKELMERIWRRSLGCIHISLLEDQVSWNSGTGSLARSLGSLWLNPHHWGEEQRGSIVISSLRNQTSFASWRNVDVQNCSSPISNIVCYIRSPYFLKFKAVSLDNRMTVSCRAGFPFVFLGLNLTFSLWVEINSRSLCFLISCLFVNRSSHEWTPTWLSKAKTA